MLKIIGFILQICRDKILFYLNNKIFYQRIKDFGFCVAYNDIVYDIIIRRDSRRIIKREELRDGCGSDKMKCGGSWRAM